MDTKEAIRFFQQLISKVENKEPVFLLPGSSLNVQTASELAIEALEKVETLETENTILKRKEVPKVPENMFIEQDLSAGYIVKRDIRGFCPTCSSGLLLYNGVHRYCPFCSQKLDWPSDKE